MAEASSNPSGRPRMTRSEAARHAALVRYGKEHALAPQTGGMSNPKIRARVAEILAENAKKAEKKHAGGKSKAKAKGKAKGKAKDARTPQEKKNQNTVQVAKQTGMSDLEGTVVRLDAGMQGAGMENDKHDELIKRGLAERHADGTVTLSATGKKWKAAAERGDAAAAQGALTEGHAKQADTQAKEKAAGDKRAAAESKKQAATAEREAKKAEHAKQVAAKKQAADKKRGQLKKAAAKQKAKKEQERQAKQDQADADTKQAVMGALEKWRKVRETQRMGKAMTTIEIDDASTARTIFAVKAGARHSRTDMEHLQAIHDSSVACGASCGPGDDTGAPMDDATDEDAAKAIKGIMDDPGFYARHECGDIMQACSALQTLCLLIQSELAEEDEDPEDISNLVGAARTLVDFLGSELDELEQAAKDDAQEDSGTIGHEPLKAITAREDVNPKAGIAEYGKVEFADAKNHKYPIDTEAHVRSAWNYISKDENASKYAADEVTQIKAKIVAAWKKLIDKAGPPSAGKALDLIHVAGGAIKALDSDTIGGYAVLFGSAEAPDIERDYYTKATDFWLDHFGWPRPITYHHGMDAATKAAPVIGHWTKATIDDTGVWLEGQLDRAHAYYAAIKQLAERGYLKLSSDSAPQWVVRERQPNGANHVKRWPLVTASTTVTPMEPRMLPVEVKAFLAELGLEGIDDSQEAVNPDAALDAAKAADDERARVLLLELELLQLELESA